MVSLRAEALRVRQGARYRCAVRALKDKRRGPGWAQDEEVDGPAGM